MTEGKGGGKKALGNHGFIDLHLYTIAAVAVLSGLLLWWTHAAWQENFEIYPSIADSLRHARADVVKGSLAVERHLAGESPLRLADADAFFEQAAQNVDDAVEVLHKAIDQRVSPREAVGIEDKLGDYRQGISRFQQLAQLSLAHASDNPEFYDVERQAAFAALEKLADFLGDEIRRRMTAMARRQDRMDTVVFFGWLSFLVFLALGLTLAGIRRRRAEEALLETESKYRLLFDQVMDVILLVAEDTGRILDCNQAVSTEWGYEQEELIGRDPAMLRLPTPQASFFGPTEVRYADGRRAVIRESRLVTRFGVLRDVSVKSGFFALGGQQVRLEIFRDITERKKDETALMEREAMLRVLGDNLPDGVIYKIKVFPDGNRKFLYISQGVERLFAITVSQALAEPGCIFSRIVREDLVLLRQAEVQAMGQLATVDVQVRFTGPDGAIRWGLFRAAPRRTSEGGVVFDGLLFDVTAQKRIEDSLRQAKAEAETASRAKSEFLANISHEVRTPLNGVLGMLQLLETSELPEDASSLVATALSCSRGLVRVLSDILDFSLIDAGRLVLRQDVCDIRTVITEVFSLLSLECEKKGLCAASAVDANVPAFVVTDAARVRQILFNLVGNAVKFTPKGQVQLDVMTVSRKGEDLYLLFAVRDTGIGIPEDKIDVIFEPFTQIDGSLTRKYGGTGLGLGIVKRLVALLDGHITVQSEPGQGTEFCFTIRCRESAAPVIEDDPLLRRAAAAPGPARVLVVEDEAVNRMATVSMLHKLGFAVEAVADGDEALDALALGGFDVVLMDIQMPRVSGDEAARRIRHGERPGVDPLIPIIALTAHAMDGDRERYLACGMDDYLAKPVDIEALGRAVSKAAALHRVLAAN